MSRSRLTWLVALAACQSAPAPARETTPAGSITGTTGASAAGQQEPDDARDSNAGSLIPGAGAKPVPAAVEVRLLPSLDAAPIEKRFAAIYGKAGRPSVAIFFNRTLSDEVREWIEPARTVTTTETSTVASGGRNGGVVMQDKSTSTTTTTPAHNPVTDARDPVAERMAWQIESAFSRPLLGQGARLVDRATIMRLVAHASGKQTDAKHDFAIKHVEMSALLGHADYYVELLVLNSPSTTLGYDLRAVVKGVKTGQIIADLTTANWTFNPIPPTPPPTRRAVTTKQGYDYEEVPAPAPHVIRPTTTEVATRMGVHALNEIAVALEHGR